MLSKDTIRTDMQTTELSCPRRNWSMKTISIRPLDEKQAAAFLVLNQAGYFKPGGAGESAPPG